MFSLMPRRRERGTAALPTRREVSPFDLLRHDFASLFDRAFPTWPLADAWETEPWGFDIEEKENEMVLRAELPGFEMKELEVTLRGNTLTVLAEHKEPDKPEGVEHRHTRLERSMTLPAGIEPDKVEASYRNGVLEVHIPLKPEAKPKRVEVKA
jgi:HSP20 family protein